MFNAVIINVKDIGKILVKICIVLSLIYILNLITSNTNFKINDRKLNISFLQCIDICIPNIGKTEKKIEEPITVSKILTIELPLSQHIINNNRVDETNIESSNEENISKETETNDYTLNISENIKTEVLYTNVPESYTDEINSVYIKNNTDFELNDEMIAQNLEFKNPKKILIYHTHTSESYTPSEKYKYEMTGNFRTTDLNYTVARVGTELANYLEKIGFEVIHDTTCYDYPSYDASYDRAYESVGNQLQESTDTEIVLDIHRDAIGDSSYAPTVKIGDEYAAQIMFVMGTNGGGLEHPNWINNLSFAIKIQKRANEKYPGLFKPIILRNSRYNQNLGKGACLIEVGATGNTLEQCNTSMKYLADVLKDVLV